jgi:hypothetical protein
MTSQTNKSEIILYQTSDGTVRIDTVFRDETIWLTQAKMAELFDVKIPAISKHLKNIFESGELDEKVVVSILENTTQHGAIEGKTQKKKVKHFNLDAIIAVGYRVNSKRATQFRIWATSILKEYIIKGFAMDDVRLKQAENGIILMNGWNVTTWKTDPMVRSVIGGWLAGRGTTGESPPRPYD